MAETTSSIDSIKAEYEEEIAALVREQDELLDQVSELTVENGRLAVKTDDLQRMVRDKEGLLMKITGGGAPASSEPCVLCGRVTSWYAEQIGERKYRKTLMDSIHAHGHSANDKAVSKGHADKKEEPSPPATTSNDEPDEHEERPLIATKFSHKDLLEDVNGYWKQSSAPEHGLLKLRRHHAFVRKYCGNPDPGDDELVAAPLETEALWQTGDGRNIMTGEVKNGLEFNTYGDILSKSAGSKAAPEEDADSGVEASGGWTEEELAFANMEITPRPWSKVVGEWMEESGEPVGGMDK